MKLKIILYCLLISLASCVSKQPNSNNPFTVVSLPFFGTITVTLNNAFSAQSFNQMPDNSGDHITSIETYKFVAGADTGTLKISIPLELAEICGEEKFDKEYLSTIEGELRTSHQDAKNYQRFTKIIDKIKVYGFLFDDGFELHGCIKRGDFIIRLTGIKDTTLKEQIMNSIKIIPTTGGWD